MAKERCQLCGQSKAKRICNIRNRIWICSVCCSKIRSVECEDCTYYEASIRYHSEKFERPPKEKLFITEIIPEIDEECNRILSMVESGDLSTGEREMRALYHKHPNYHTVLYGMGVCAALQDQYEEAIKFFERATDIFPYFTEAHFNRAMACIKLGDIGGMVRGFREVIRIGGDKELVSEAKSRLDGLEKMVREHKGLNLDTYIKNSEIYNRAFSSLEKREFISAINLFRRVLETDPNHVQSWGNLGLAYAGIGERAKAIECLDKALELDPDYELAMVNKIAIEELKEGERLEGKIESVNYYRDYKARGKRSYIAETIRNLFGKRD